MSAEVTEGPTLEANVLPEEPGEAIRIRGARVHNLKNVDVDIPHGRLVVLTGVSGSGKSSLAFDVLHAEAQRRYLESLSVQARHLAGRIEPPDADSIDALPPTLAIDQRFGGARARSTVATLCEAADYLRLLYARAGRAHCPGCGRPVSRQTPQQIADRILALEDRQRVMLLAPVVRGRKGEHRDVFESILKAGFVRARVDGEIVDAAAPPKLAKGRPHDVEIVVDRIVVKDGIRLRLLESVTTALQRGEGACIVSHEKDGQWIDRLCSERFACADCGISYAELEPRTFRFNSPYGACPECEGLGVVAESASDASERADVASDPHVCPACDGSRLNPFARAVEVAGVTLPKLFAMTARQAAAQMDAWLTAANCREEVVGAQAAAGVTEGKAASGMGPEDAAVARSTLPEALHRLRFLVDVGLEYLTLDRSATTLSGGELQRCRLASCLGAGLTGVCYLLDEPTAGLHPRDTSRLIQAVEGLRDQGNSVVVVEHDIDVMRRADWMIDLGPGAGREGGRVVATGTPAAVARQPASATGRWLSESHTGTSRNRPVPSQGAIVLAGARRHNLRNVTATIPLQRFVCVTGVSGSGKSTLIADTLAPALRQGVAGAEPKGEFDSLTGHDSLRRIVEVDQSSLGRTSRSTPATYSGLWDEIRKLLARTKDARVRGFTSRRFSLADSEGRCADCRGLGVQRLALGFLPDHSMPCATCRGARFNRATLAVRYGGRNAAEILDLRIDEARDVFRDVPKAAAPLATFCDLGLGYLTLGQPATTLSGGESQRVKLASELCRGGTEPTLFLLDEPTTGLHPADIERLIDVLQRFVDGGHTVLTIEHQLQVIAAADWVIDLGPEGGAEGGRNLYAGPPEGLKDEPQSHTGAALRGWLEGVGRK